MILQEKITVDRPVDVAWKYFTNQKRWGYWYGKKVEDVTWEKSARINFIDNQGSTILDIVPERKLVLETVSGSEEWDFSDTDNYKTELLFTSNIGRGYEERINVESWNRSVSVMLIRLKKVIEVSWDVNDLIAKLIDRNEKDNSVEALVEIGVTTIEPLISAFIKATRPWDDWILRLAIKGTLVRIGAPAIDQLIVTLNNEHPCVRKEAVDALGQIGDPRAIEALIHALENEDDSSVQGAIETALDDLRK